jgi:pyruvate-formate lyase-activating enzyme
MGIRLHPGDSCPECGEALDYRPRSISTLFLRGSQLRCPNCNFVARKRRAYAHRTVTLQEGGNSYR